MSWLYLVLSVFGLARFFYYVVQFTTCTTTKPLFHHPYKLKYTIYDLNQFVYIYWTWMQSNANRAEMIFVAPSDNLIHRGVWIKNWTPRMMLWNQNFSNPSGRIKYWIKLQWKEKLKGLNFKKVRQKQNAYLSDWKHIDECLEKDPSIDNQVTNVKKSTVKLPQRRKRG